MQSRSSKVVEVDDKIGKVLPIIVFNGGVHTCEPTHLLHPYYNSYYTSTTPLLHSYYSITTSLLHTYYTPTTPLLQLWYSV